MGSHSIDAFGQGLRLLHQSRVHLEHGFKFLLDRLSRQKQRLEFPSVFPLDSIEMSHQRRQHQLHAVVYRLVNRGLILLSG